LQKIVTRPKVIILLIPEARRTTIKLGGLILTIGAHGSGRVLVSVLWCLGFFFPAKYAHH
jgi:hypothetical protein